MAERPEIFVYHDYRAYLRDMYAYLKGSNPNFSHRAFSLRAGLKAPNELKRVMDGERNLTPRTLEAFIAGLQLQPHEARHFRNLVGLGQATTDDDRAYHYEQMRRSGRYRSTHNLAADRFAYLSHWYIPAIRELAGMDGFDISPEWISARLRPRIGRAEAAEAIEVLKRLGFIRQDEQGRWRRTDELITTGDEVGTLSVRNFHRQMLERAVDALEGIPPTERNISSFTMAVSRERAEALLKYLHEVRKDIIGFLQDDDSAPEVVMQVNLQGLPLTTGLETREEAGEAA